MSNGVAGKAGISDDDDDDDEKEEAKLKKRLEKEKRLINLDTLV